MVFYFLYWTRYSIPMWTQEMHVHLMNDFVNSYGHWHLLFLFKNQNRNGKKGLNWNIKCTFSYDTLLALVVSSYTWCSGNLVHIIAKIICSPLMGFRQRLCILLSTINVMILLGGFPLYVVLYTSCQVLTVQWRLLDRVTGRRLTGSLSSAVWLRTSVLTCLIQAAEGWSLYYICS